MVQEEEGTHVFRMRLRTSDIPGRSPGELSQHFWTSSKRLSDSPGFVAPAGLFGRPPDQIRFTTSSSETPSNGTFPEKI